MHNFTLMHNLDFVKVNDKTSKKRSMLNAQIAHKICRTSITKCTGFLIVFFSYLNRVPICKENLRHPMEEQHYSMLPAILLMQPNSLSVQEDSSPHFPTHRSGIEVEVSHLRMSVVFKMWHEDVKKKKDTHIASITVTANFVET